MANVLKDAITHELTRIRLALASAKRSVKTSWRRQDGIRKAQGRGVNRVKKDKKDE